MAKNNEHKGIEKTTTTLGKETSFNGVLRFKESLKIDGSFEGEIESPGFLFIENGATVKANIKVGSVVVGGIVRGNIEASERLEMLTTGKVFGNIRTAKLNIAVGVVFVAMCYIKKNPENIFFFSARLANIKKATQSI
jgi:cytoskeletal protein CcmA (bactofilin family)